MAIQFTPGGLHYSLPDIPNCFTEPSAGIMAWKKGHRMDEFFHRWRQRYRDVENQESTQGAWDQRSLRWALWESDIRFCNIPTEFQFCLYKPEICMDEVRMIHGRNIPSYILDQINAHRGLRFYQPKIGVTPIYYEASIYQLMAHAMRSIHVLVCQILRRLLHRSGIMPFPQKRRPD
jgi:hypothetical protein